MEEDIQQECQMFNHLEENKRENYRIKIVPDLGIIPVILPILERNNYYCSLCCFIHYHFPYYTWNDLEQFREAKDVKRLTILNRNMLQFRIKNYCENMKLFVSERHIRFPISELIQQMFLFQRQTKTTIFTTLKTRINHGGYMYESLDLSCANYHFHIVSTSEKPMLYNEIIKRDNENFIRIYTKNYCAIALSRSPSRQEMNEIENLVKCSNLVGITVFHHPTNKNAQYVLICGSVVHQQAMSMEIFFLCSLQNFMVPKKFRISELVGKIKYFSIPDPKIMHPPQEKYITFYYNTQASQFKYLHSIPQCYVFLKILPYKNNYMMKLIRSFCATDCRNGIPAVLGNQETWSKREGTLTSTSSVYFLNSTDLGVVKIVPRAKSDPQYTIDIMRIYEKCLDGLVHFAKIYMRCERGETANTLYMEKGDKSFNDLVETQMFGYLRGQGKKSDAQEIEYDYSVLLFQVLISLQIAWDRCKFNHNDLHTSNILVTDTKFHVLYTYKYNENVFKVSSRYCVKIIDFDRAASETVPPRIIYPLYMWTQKTTSFRDVYTFLMGEIAHRPLMLFPNLKNVFELFLRTNEILFDNVERYIAEYTEKCKDRNSRYGDFEKLFLSNMNNRAAISARLHAPNLYHRFTYNFRFNVNDNIDKIPEEDIYEGIEDEQRVTPIFWANEVYANAIQPFQPTHPNVFQVDTVITTHYSTCDCQTNWSYLCTDEDVSTNKFVMNIFSLWEAPRAPYCQELQRHDFYPYRLLLSEPE